jgi:hypothetical protein
VVNSVARQPLPEDPYSSKRDESVLSSEPQFFVGVDPTATIEEMENAIWQNIGGHEIISLVRRDLVDGTNVDYSVINNLKKLFEEYNPRTIFSIENSASAIFQRFGIKLENYVPSTRKLLQIREGLTVPVTRDEDGQVVVYVQDVRDDQEVEVQILGSRRILRDTIYESTFDWEYS